MFGHGESVELHRYVGKVRNSHGAVVEQYADPVVIDGVGIAPGTSSEPGGATSYRVVTQTTIYVPSETVIGPQDQVTVRGIRYEVVGDMSGEWRNPFTGWNPGSAVTLKRVTG